MTASWRRTALLISGAVLLAACLVPTPYLASPRWDISVVYTDNSPLSGIEVQLVYVDYSTGKEDHELRLITDETGHVVFPEQFQKASLVRRLFFTLVSANGGAHAGFGRHAYVFARDRTGREGDITFGQYATEWSGSPSSVKSRIVLH